MLASAASHPRDRRAVYAAEIDRVLGVRAARLATAIKTGYRAAMRDIDIRAVLRREVVEQHRSEGDTRIIDELGLKQGQVRVDLAVVNGVLKGYEIKSRADTLRRLPTQVAVYSQVLDYATIVLAETHREDACEIIPKWWEVIIAVECEDGLRLEVSRPALVNPNVDARALAELLWHSEALALLRARSAERGLSRKPRAAAWDRLCECYELGELKAAVRERLKERQPPRAVRLPR